MIYTRLPVFEVWMELRSASVPHKALLGVCKWPAVRRVNEQVFLDVWDPVRGIGRGTLSCAIFVNSDNEQVERQMLSLSRTVEPPQPLNTDTDVIHRPQQSTEVSNSSVIQSRRNGEKTLARTSVGESWSWSRLSVDSLDGVALGREERKTDERDGDGDGEGLSHLTRGPSYWDVIRKGDLNPSEATSVDRPGDRNVEPVGSAAYTQGPGDRNVVSEGDLTDTLIDLDVDSTVEPASPSAGGDGDYSPRRGGMCLDVLLDIRPRGVLGERDSDTMGAFVCYSFPRNFRDSSGSSESPLQQVKKSLNFKLEIPCPD